ncbi:MAG: (2Fe-2S)-binding protein [Methylococcales bacterium]|nr:(2Fe-2S)-binding protein [Methylococcales bacterium]
MIKLTINGEPKTLTLPDDTPLLWALRDELGLTGTKFGCGISACGVCTVHVEGQAVRACVTPIGKLQGQHVTTIEAISQNSVGAKVQSAWVALNVPQCGYCQSGQIMSATLLLQQNPQPSDADIDQAMRANLCRCGTYPRIRAAIKQAAKTLQEDV